MTTAKFCNRWGLFALVLGALIFFSRDVWYPVSIPVRLTIEAQQAFMAQVFYTPTTNLTFGMVEPCSQRVEKGVNEVEFLIPSRTLCQLRIDLGSKPNERFALRNVRAGENETKLDANRFSASSHCKVTNRTETELQVQSCGGDPYLVYKGDLSNCVSCGRSLRRVALLPLWLIFLSLLSAGICRIACGWTRSFCLWLKEGAFPETNGRSVSLDILRIIAFLMVVFSHVCIQVQPTFISKSFQLNAPNWGPFGVMLFFFLSGAAMTQGTFNRLEKTGVWNFYVSRARAVLPSFWTAYFFVCMGFFLCKGFKRMGGDWLCIVQSMFAVDGYLLARGDNYYLLGEWYMGCMLLLYLVVPLVYGCIRKNSFLTLAGAFLISVVTLKYSSALSRMFFWWHPLSRFNMPVHLAEFVAGIVLFRSIRTTRRFYLFTIIVTLGYLAVYLCFPHRYLFGSSLAGIPAAVSVFTLGCFVCDFLCCSEGVENLIGFFAKNSFLAFLYHHVLIRTVLNQGSTESPLQFWYGFIAIVTLSYVLAYLSGKPVAAIKNLFPGGVKNAQK